MESIFVLGCTASGKSALAIELAERLGECEIVSADAYQVYRELPILSAAPTAAELARVPHHLVGSLSVTQPNDAATHARAAQACLADIHARGKRAIVTGGSGLYVKFISHGISEAPPADEVLRAELEALSQEELVARFEEADPEGLAATAVANRRYLVRNLEIVLAGGKPLSYWRQNWEGVQAAGQGYCVTRDADELEERIALRARQMLYAGVLDEVRALEGMRLSGTAEKCLGLREVRACLRGEMSEADLVESLRLQTRQYAKRQRTWLRREQWVQAVAPGEL